MSESPVRRALAPLSDPLVRQATVAFFCLLAGYYVLRPIREEMGIAGGVDQLQWLYTGTFVVITALVVPVSWAVAKWRRSVVVPGMYVLAAVGLVGTYGLSEVASGATAVWLARGLYVGISTFNMFAISLFWALVSDVMSTEQSKRSFGTIAAAGSLGAIVGPALTSALAGEVGPFPLLLLASVLLVAAAVATRRVATSGSTTGDGDDAPLGGGLGEGLRRLVRSPQLLGICGYVALFATTSTFLYFLQAHIVEAAVADSGERTALFANMDLTVNVIALVVQFGVVAELLRRFGVSLVLGVLPVLTIVVFGALAVAPVLLVLVVAQVVRRAANFALAKPAREILFTGVDRTERYKTKIVIDTVAYRGSDAAAGWMFAALLSVGLSLPAIAGVAIPIAGVWAWVSRDLGRRAVAAQPDEPGGAGA